MVSYFLNYCHIEKIDGIFVYICGKSVREMRRFILIQDVKKSLLAPLTTQKSIKG